MVVVFVDQGDILKFMVDIFYEILSSKSSAENYYLLFGNFFTHIGL